MSHTSSSEDVSTRVTYSELEVEYTRILNMLNKLQVQVNHADFWQRLHYLFTGKLDVPTLDFPEEWFRRWPKEVS